MSQTDEKQDHARQNAQAWAQSIAQMVAALECDYDSVRERIQESVLEVAVRSGWSPTAQDMEAEDFLILLSTGGPALRIRGELDQHKQPHRAWLEYQDWGTPWTEYFGEGCSQETLLTFCQQFYFGE